ncbi:MAG: ferric reductase-like transmembrane domain-containing protein [Bacteroidales bacterium]|jgi:DMSO/TMAO reductase YedYZ heme-binding membrane subunit|nr:ferric reductase-like transmembrane domain-containing protein [Bacteroidales bacterium]
MVKLLIDFIRFLYTLAPLLMALGVLVLLAVLLSKSIRRHAAVYYTVFAIPFAMVAIPFTGRLLGVEMFSFGRVPFLGGVIRDYIHAGTLGFPLLIIIMYTGALNPRNSTVRKLLGIRRELSILSGFPILTHSLIRVTNSFPAALRFFTDNEGYMAGGNVISPLGAGMSNFSLVLGILLLILFLPLWVTSFGSVRKRMGSVRWKKLQRWSYVLYALLFIHAMGLQVGGLLNPRGGRHAQVENIQATGNHGIEAENIRNQTGAGNSETQANPEMRGRGRSREAAGSGRETRTEPANRPDGRERMHENRETGAGERDHAPNVQTEGGRGNNAGVSAGAGRGGHVQSAGFADIKTGPQTGQYIHIVSLVLIFGSYLYLRLRKERKDRAKRKSQTAEA